MSATSVKPVRTGVHGAVARVQSRLGPLWSAAATIGILTGGGKLLGLVKEIVVASRFGTGAEMDAFLLALSVPTFAINVIVGMLPMALTPAFVSTRARDGQGAARLLAGTAFRQTYIVMSALAVLLAAGTVLMAYFPNTVLSPAARDALPAMAAMLIPFTILQGAAAAWSGVLAADGTFAISAISTVALPALTLLSVLVLGPALGVMSMAIGLVAGCVVQAVLLGRALAQRGLTIFATGGNLADVNRQYLPAIGGAIFASGCGLVDQLMASWLPTGAVSTIAYGSKFVHVGMGIAIVAIGTPLLPHLSRLVEQQQWVALRHFQRRASVLILAITIPTALLLSVGSEAMVRVAFERGAFTSADTTRVGLVQAFYMLQLPGQFVAVIYARSIAALRMNVFLTGVAVVSLTVNVLANLAFMRVWGVAGIALSTAVVQSVSAGLLFFACDRIVGQRIRATTASTLSD